MKQDTLAMNNNEVRYLGMNTSGATYLFMNYNEAIYLGMQYGKQRTLAFPSTEVFTFCRLSRVTWYLILIRYIETTVQVCLLTETIHTKEQNQMRLGVFSSSVMCKLSCDYCIISSSLHQALCIIGICHSCNSYTMLYSMLYTFGSLITMHSSCCTLIKMSVSLQ